MDRQDTRPQSVAAPQPASRVMVGEAVEFIRTRTTSEPEIGIILGTGLGGLVREIEV